MKTISAGLATLFASANEYVMADLYTITLSSGTILKYTTFDVDLTYGVNTWLSAAPVMERSRIRTVIGLEVDTLNLTVTPHSTDMIGSQTWLQAVYSGVLDGAKIQLDRAFMAAGTTTVAGTVNLFVGNVAQITLDRVAIEMTVNSPIDMLSVQMPRNLYQAGCQHTLFDDGCTLARSTWTKNGSVGASPTVTQFPATITGAAAGTLNLGTLQFTSGALAGTKRTVKTWDGTNIVLLSPLPVAPTPGNAFTVTFGCDKQFSTCQNTFANQSSFKGFPLVPVPETAI